MKVERRGRTVYAFGTGHFSWTMNEKNSWTEQYFVAKHRSDDQNAVTAWSWTRRIERLAPRALSPRREAHHRRHDRPSFVYSFFEVLPRLFIHPPPAQTYPKLALALALGLALAPIRAAFQP